jgi:Mn2+/Fe2+ NRAMP family transporter
MLLGTALSVAHANAIKLLILSAVINGLLAPPLIVLILFVSNNGRIMGVHRNTRWLNVLGGCTAVAMTAAGAALCWTWFAG